jgi:lipoprotein signal peptidase
MPKSKPIFAHHKKQLVKARQIVLLIFLVIFADQALKFYIKLHYYAGEEHNVIGNWFKLHFVENEGMAWGWKFGGGWGKIILTLFRLVAVIWGSFLLRDFIRKHYHKGFIICAALIYAGALGNLIDSLFYGLIFRQAILFRIPQRTCFLRMVGMQESFMVKWLICYTSQSSQMRIIPNGFLLWVVMILNSSARYSILLMRLFQQA